MTSSTLRYCPSKKGLKYSTTLLKQSSFTCGPCFRNMFYWIYLIGSGYERILSPKWLLNNYTDGKRYKILWVSRVTLLSSRTKCTYHFISYKERKQVRLILLAVGNIYYIYVLCYRYFERRGPFFFRILHTNDH